MLAVIVTILLALWLVGEITANTFGGSLHLLFLAAFVVFAASLFREARRA